MTTLTEDDVLEQLDAQNNLLAFMTTAHSFLLQGIKCCLSITMKRSSNMQ